MSDIELDSSDGESNNTVDKTSKKRKSYSIKMKLEVIDYAKKNSKNSASKHFKIGRTQVINWINQEDEIRKLQ
jgi:hypothetical protein